MKRQNEPLAEVIAIVDKDRNALELSRFRTGKDFVPTDLKPHAIGSYAQVTGVSNEYDDSLESYITQDGESNFTIDVNASVQDVNKPVDLTGHGTHFSLDHYNTEKHDDAHRIVQLERRLWMVYVSVPDIAAKTNLRLETLPTKLETQVSKGLSLNTGQHNAFTLQMLFDGRTIHDILAYRSIIDVVACAHPKEKEPYKEGIIALPKKERDLLRTVFQTKSTNYANDCMMRMQWQALSCFLQSKGEVAPYASVQYDETHTGKQFRYLEFSATPRSTGANAVVGTSPLRRPSDRVSIWQALAVCNRQHPLISYENMSAATKILTRDRYDRAMKRAA